MKIINGEVFIDNSHFEKLDLYVENGVFTESASGDTVDASDCYVIPGLIDIHIHGCVGTDASGGEDDCFKRMGQFLKSVGVTSFCPTTMTLPIPELERAFIHADKYRKNRVDGSRLIGVNMEGPYFSMSKKGAQNPDYIKNPDIDEFMRLYKVSNGVVAIADVAPELDGALEYVKHVSQYCAVSIAHSNADYTQVKAALDAGATGFTHLFNAMTGLNHRAPGAVGAAFESDSCYTELICDCIHIHPAVIKTVFKTVGCDRVCAISDALPCAGLPEGRYISGGLEVWLKDGCARLENGTLAGSASTLFDNFKKLVEIGIPLECAVKACSANPAKYLGVADKVGIIGLDKNADFLILDKKLNLKAVFIGGKKEL